MDLLPFIFHEKQEGSLCAQHALNALLQGPYFSAVDLADLSQQLDIAESQNLSLPKPESTNYDDSGFFSIQVIAKALQIWNLELISIKAKQESISRSCPEIQAAFICNFEEHWFTLRKFGDSKYRWYNLNSNLVSPEYISETYLSMLLQEYQHLGYNVFVVKGILPDSDADNVAKSYPKVPEGISLQPTRLENRNSLPTTALDLEEETQLEKALLLSLGVNFE